jgi:hypothetical protein
MSDDLTNEVFVGRPGGSRKAGRPKLRWLDCIENDLKSMVSRDGGRKQKTDLYVLSL